MNLRRDGPFCDVNIIKRPRRAAYLVRAHSKKRNLSLSPSLRGGPIAGSMSGRA